jgi:hypothetical protein
VSTPDQAYGGARAYASGGQATTSPDYSGGSDYVANRPAAAAAVRGGPRTVRLTASKLDAWSVMKIAFLLSVALGIAGVVMVGVLWSVLDTMGVFESVNRTVGTVMGTASGTTFNLLDYIGFGRVISLATVIGVIDVFLWTALSTLGAILYNICASLVGGVQITLSDD